MGKAQQFLGAAALVAQRFGINLEQAEILVEQHKAFVHAFEQALAMVALAPQLLLDQLLPRRRRCWSLSALCSSIRRITCCAIVCSTFPAAPSAPGPRRGIEHAQGAEHRAVGVVELIDRIEAQPGAPTVTSGLQARRASSRVYGRSSVVCCPARADLQIECRRRFARAQADFPNLNHWLPSAAVRPTTIGAFEQLADQGDDVVEGASVGCRGCRRHPRRQRSPRSVRAGSRRRSSA